jgi:hypothetical protein
MTLSPFGRLKRWHFRNLSQPKIRASSSSLDLRTSIGFYMGSHGYVSTRQELVNYIMETYPDIYVNQASCRNTLNVFLSREKTRGTVVERGDRLFWSNEGGMGIAIDFSSGLVLACMIMADIYLFHEFGRSVGVYLISGAIIFHVLRTIYETRRILRLKLPS